MATTYLYRTAGTPTNSDKWTFSTWVKSAWSSGNEGTLIGTRVDANNYEFVGFDSQPRLRHYLHYSGSASGQLKTTAKYRDYSAWYHVVYVWDSGNADASLRQRMYVNGVELSAFDTDDNATQNQDSLINTSGNTVYIGVSDTADSNSFFQGSLAHTHFCDGQAYAASDFGETDSTSGIWVAKTSPSVTYGNNGFFLKYQDTSAFGDDSSGNNNDFTMSGTITQTKDTPDNNFATLNSVYPSNGFTSQSPTWSNGNNTFATSNASSQWGISPSTIGLSTGKWYAECKISATSGETLVGILSSNWTSNTYLGLDATDYGYYASNGNIRNDGGTAYGNSYTAGDIIGIYLDLDNNKLYFGKNGTIQNSGTGFSITAPASTDKGLYLLAAQEWNSGGNGTFQWNFGNGYFGTTAVSSGVADAGGEGTFEYDPSSGTFDGSSKDFRAICTANLATYG